MKLVYAKRIVVFVVGLTVVLVGFALLFIPGPGVATIVGGLAILATEFMWARRWLRRLQREAVNMGSSIVGEGRMKKALGDDFVANSKKEVTMDDQEARVSSGGHEEDVPETAPGHGGIQPKSEQEKPGSPTETNRELAAKFPEATTSNRPN